MASGAELQPRVSNSSRTTSSGICLPRFLLSRRTQRSSGERRCENYHLCSHPGIAVRWPSLWSRQRFVGKASACPPYSGLRAHPDTRPVSTSGSHECPWPLRRRWGSCFDVRLLERNYLWTIGGLRWCHQTCHRDPDMSPWDMRLVASSKESACSELSEPLPRALCGPLDWFETARPATTAAYASTPPGRSEVPAALVIYFALGVLGRGPVTDRAQGDGWRAQTGRLSWKILHLSYCSRGAVETRGRSHPHRRLRWMIDGGRTPSVSLGGCKGLLLLANCHCFSQLRKKRGRFKVGKYESLYFFPLVWKISCYH